MSVINTIYNYLFPTASLTGCNRSCGSRPETAQTAEQEPVATPAPESLRTECLSVSAESTAALSQLGCLTGGVQTAQTRTDEARSAYLGLFGQVLSRGTIIMKRPDNEATSEGIGFGGLIFSASNSPESQAAFWQIYNARNAYFVRDNGVMAWSLNADGSVRNADSASDGDQDWIAAQLTVLNHVQCGQWQMPTGITLASFRTQIQNDLNAFWTNHVGERGGRLIFLATNGGWAQRGDGRDIYYPNYPDPHFLRMFGQFDAAHEWPRLADDVQTLNQVVVNNYSSLGAAGQNPVPARVFIRVSGSGTFTVENYYTISRAEGVPEDTLRDNEADAIRFFLRQGRAAVLGNDQRARNMLAQIISTAQVTTPSSAHIYAGADGAPSPLGWNNTFARANYGIAVLGSGDSTRAQSFFCTVMNNHQGQYFGEWEGARNHYYDQSLILQILDLAFNQ